MPRLSAKRQITLSIDQCKLAGIEPGDHYRSFVDNDRRITIVKKVAGAAKGVLKGIKTNNRYTEEQSQLSGINCCR